MAPLNEAAVGKLVCTTIRPTLFPQPEMATLSGAVETLSDLIGYEPLSDPKQEPEHLVSPQTLLKWQVGLDPPSQLAQFSCGVVSE